jgi:hypothetical protein
MNKRLRNRWIGALRSGEYKKGRHNLYARGRYCCLGVLCAIQGMDCRSKIDMSVLAKYMCVIDPPHIAVLVSLNDAENKTFKQIADYIERVL